MRRKMLIQHWHQMENIWNLNRKTMLSDISGKQISAVKVFALSIKYLKEHFMTTLKMSLPDASEKDVKFVLTVPAIWTDAAKLFMREAAKEAGIASERLLLALEPECASVYCKDIAPDKLSRGKCLTANGKRTQYVVADIGGGTADFSVHELEIDGSITELHKASGEAYGGTCVDKKYVEIIQSIYGVKSFERLKHEEMEDYLEFLRDFEVKKRTVTKELAKKYNIRIPLSLNDFAKGNKVDLQRRECLSVKREFEVMRDRIKVNGHFMLQLFEDSINEISNHLQNLLKDYPDISCIILVGGYSECSILQEKISLMCADKNVIIPNECGLAVVKGAVLYGHNPSIVSCRVLRYTYGTNTDFRFETGKHDEKRKYIDQYGIVRCRGTFDPIISSGTKVLASGKKCTLKSVPLDKFQSSVISEIYFSEKSDVLYIDEEDCRYLGKVEIPLPYLGFKPTLEEEFTFGMTELVYTATIQETQQTVVKHFNVFDVV
ncbi:heat shock 70 kDa protein 12A-like isoform X2 [Saccostrea cucullata]|uniref:heat shock 70 kDa protein 12A-like isoform X2 n=1 Tax=Saccostrea cuccullata TaxID=36930 RepID=UPI002ED408E8